MLHKLNEAFGWVHFQVDTKVERISIVRSSFFFPFSRSLSFLFPILCTILIVFIQSYLAEYDYVLQEDDHDAPVSFMGMYHPSALPLQKSSSQY